MSTRAEQFALVQDATFIGRVAVAIMAKASAVAVESASGVNSSRNRLATRVLQDPLDWAGRFAYPVVENTTIAALDPLNNTTATDAMIDSALSNTFWDKLAEAYV